MTKKKSVAQAIVNGELVDLMLETTADNVFMADGKNVEETIAATNKSITDLTKKHTDDINAVNNKHTQDINTANTNLNNRVFNATVTVSGNIIKVTNGSGITKRDGMLMTFKMPSNMNVANIHINMFGANIPLKSSADNAIVDEMIGGVCYLVTYASNSFFISGGGGKAKILYENYSIPIGKVEGKTLDSLGYIDYAYNAAYTLSDNKIYYLLGYARYDSYAVTEAFYAFNPITETIETKADRLYYSERLDNISIEKEDCIYVVGCKRFDDYSTDCYYAQKYTASSNTWSDINVPFPNYEPEYTSDSAIIINHGKDSFKYYYKWEDRDFYDNYCSMIYNFRTNTWGPQVSESTPDVKPFYWDSLSVRLYTSDEYTISYKNAVMKYLTSSKTWSQIANNFSEIVPFPSDYGNSYLYGITNVINDVYFIHNGSRSNGYTAGLYKLTPSQSAAEMKASVVSYKLDNVLVDRYSGAISYAEGNIYAFGGNTSGSGGASTYITKISCPVRFKKLNGSGTAVYNFDDKTVVNRGTVFNKNTNVKINLPATIYFSSKDSINGYIKYDKNVKNI